MADPKRRLIPPMARPTRQLARAPRLMPRRRGCRSPASFRSAMRAARKAIATSGRGADSAAAGGQSRLSDARAGDGRSTRVMVGQWLLARWRVQGGASRSAPSSGRMSQDHRRRAAARLWRGHRRQYRATSPSWCARPQAKGAQVVLPPELFEGPYFCRIEDEGLFADARADGRASLGAGDAEAGRGAEDLDPDQLLRGRRAALLQLAGDDRTRRQGRWASTARATSPTARAMRRNSISAPATPASRSGRAQGRRSASASAGTNGIPKPPAR